VSYDVHIHRAENSFDAGESPIPREEWEKWVADAPDFHFDTESYVTFRYDDGERNEYLAVWTGHPRGEEFALHYYDGTVTTGNPDEHLLRRMAEIAHDLGARLQGDDGEFYGLDGKPLPED
jgi:hypothetical protein